MSAQLADDGALIVCVADTSIGMSNREVQQALEPFGQIEGAAQHGDEGPGLGLCVAKALAEANMAEFRIMSEPRRGTQVELRFPPERVQEVKEGGSDATAATG